MAGELPKVEPADLEPRLDPLPDIRAVTWNVYGTLLAISGGTLLFEHHQEVITDLALDKTIQEFKMWAAMSRRPGQPTEYFGPLYAMQSASNERNFRRWRNQFSGSRRRCPLGSVVQKLLKKDYKFDTGFYGVAE